MVFYREINEEMILDQKMFNSITNDNNITIMITTVMEITLLMRFSIDFIMGSSFYWCVNF